ncbi:spindle pole body component 110-like [Dorcoceras hygrometricum]|uniref:Spindle pole body component 110-like n=1 Tax=Dorcoceras hygrometricum TaxID=472368 RepID=A0A2Z7CH11_9LAMI|nr:spindle pole body component 110-like [Dorcoceras hygrometricum]
MAQEYWKFSQSFEEVKAERESCATKAELVSSSDMKAALSKLATENEELKSRSREMLYVNQRLAGIISSWTRSSASLDKLHGAMKPTGEKSCLGYDGNDSSTVDTSCTPQLERTKFKTMNFVKSSTGQPVEAQYREIIIADEPLIWKGRFWGLGIRLLKCHESWLKKLEKMKGKPKSGGKNQSQLSRTSTKDRQYRPRYKKPRSQEQHATYQYHTRLKNTHGPHTCPDVHTGKWVIFIQVWVPKGLIKPGPK